jgi:hypothetical protein
MASAKAWYWLGLAVMALSLMSSGTGRSMLHRADAYVSCIRSRAIPYLGTIELAMGQTEAGVGHLQAVAEQNRARMEAERAQIEATRAMLQDRAVQEEMRQAQEVLSNRALMQRAMLASEISIPALPVLPPGIEVMNGRHQHVIICPRTRMRVNTPRVHVSVAPPQEPI